jgi:hypothetical protein
MDSHNEKGRLEKARFEPYDMTVYQAFSYPSAASVKSS